MSYCYSWTDFNSHPRLKTTSKNEIYRLLSIDVNSGIFTKLESAKGSEFTSYYDYVDFALSHFNSIIEKEF